MHLVEFQALNSRPVVHDGAVRPCRQRVAVSLEGIQVPFQSIDRALQSLFFGASIHMQSIESWAVCVESLAIPLNDRENLDVHAVLSLPYSGMRRLRLYGLILADSLRAICYL